MFQTAFGTFLFSFCCLFEVTGLSPFFLLDFLIPLSERRHISPLFATDVGHTILVDRRDIVGNIDVCNSSFDDCEIMERCHPSD
ncbi:hypothetical protein DFJ73DRAFT_830988 [Zopfochytrium polystomum]|nr:hypothetical protein DFJ73DRAFT_830988 [Zopfochytrium polystomum]